MLYERRYIQCKLELNVPPKGNQVNMLNIDIIRLKLPPWRSFNKSIAVAILNREAESKNLLLELDLFLVYLRYLDGAIAREQAQISEPTRRGRGGGNPQVLKCAKCVVSP